MELLNKNKFVNYINELQKDIRKVLNIKYLNHDGMIHFDAQLEILKMITEDINNGKFDIV